MTHTKKAVPGHGEGVSGADGRGKLEQKRIILKKPLLLIL